MADASPADAEKDLDWKAFYRNAKTLDAKAFADRYKNDLGTPSQGFLSIFLSLFFPFSFFFLPILFSFPVPFPFSFSFLFLSVDFFDFP